MILISTHFLCDHLGLSQMQQQHHIPIHSNVQERLTHIEAPMQNFQSMDGIDQIVVDDFLSFMYQRALSTQRTWTNELL